MTLLEGRVGGGGDGPEVTTLTARFHSGNGPSAVKQKMMDTTPSTVQDESPFLLHLSHQQQQQRHQQRSVVSSFVDVRSVTSPQRVPEMLHSSSHNVCENPDGRQQHELKNWSEVSTVLLQQTSEESKEHRHSLANESYNDRNNNNPSENQMNF